MLTRLRNVIELCHVDTQLPPEFGHTTWGYDLIMILIKLEINESIIYAITDDLF